MPTVPDAPMNKRGSKTTNGMKIQEHTGEQEKKRKEKAKVHVEYQGEIEKGNKRAHL